MIIRKGAYLKVREKLVATDQVVAVGGADCGDCHSVLQPGLLSDQGLIGEEDRGEI